MLYELNETEASVIESMRANNVAKRKRAAQVEIAEATKSNYFENPQDTICQILSGCLLRHGFVVPDFCEVGSTSNGLQNYDCQGCFLAVTWFRMPSGKFEIVAYIS